MSSINIQALIQRESDWVIVQGSVGGCVMDGDGRVSETCDELLDPTNSLDASDGRAECRAIPEEQVQPRTNRVSKLTR